MADSAFTVLARQTMELCHHIKEEVVSNPLARAVYDVFSLPTAQIDRIEKRVEDRKTEEEKDCQFCQGTAERIKVSDVMCKQCKLELSLGRKVK
ncbi:hypothetical protein [Teredinibacter haidensis]|uniref:hypothetical protein n=1 Tax=Teredinibacter haidensis TaxID=2731755 RepID=UPI000948FB10|nr:hypothetical protein [Teredinibacter haidensis]